MFLVTSDFIAALSFKSLSLDFIICKAAILSVPPIFHPSPPPTSWFYSHPPPHSVLLRPSQRIAAMGSPSVCLQLSLAKEVTNRQSEDRRGRQSIYFPRFLATRSPKFTFTQGLFRDPHLPQL